MRRHSFAVSPPVACSGSNDHEKQNADEAVQAMGDEQALTRPIGWWLKEADARLNAAFDSALTDTGVDRRGWQVLASLSRGPVGRTDLVNTLASFDPPAAIEETIDRLTSHGWIAVESGTATLTHRGVEEHGALAPLIDGVRRQVSDALPRTEYTALIGLLTRLVDAFPPSD